MEVKEVIYERLVNTGNYENRKYGVKILLEKGDFTHDAFEKAKNLIEGFIKDDKIE